MSIGENPVLSVIIPVYKAEKYIERCARSLFKQRLSKIEFIFIDDCTPDKSIEVLESLINENKAHIANMNWEVIIERMPVNSGQAAVRKQGITMAKGKYIIHCDSDDWAEPNMFVELMNIAIRDDADMAVCDFYRTDGHEKCIKEKAADRLDNNSFLISILYQKYSWALWNKMVKKELYDKLLFYPQYNIGEDMVIIAQLINLSRKISYINKPLYNYYLNPDSTMHVTGEEISDNKYFQLKCNTQTLIKFLKHHLSKKEYKRVLPSLIINSTLPILHYANKPKYRSIFKTEIEGVLPLLFNFNIKWKYKLIYILVMFKLYPVPFK